LRCGGIFSDSIITNVLLIPARKAYSALQNSSWIYGGLFLRRRAGVWREEKNKQERGREDKRRAERKDGIGCSTASSSYWSWLRP